MCAPVPPLAHRIEGPAQAPAAPTPHRAAATAVINKRIGGTGLISGRKAFQRPVVSGVELLKAIQDVYLDPSVTVA